MNNMVTTTWKCRTDTLPAMYPCEKCQGLFTETIQRVDKNNQIIDTITCVQCEHSFSKKSILKSCKTLILPERRFSPLVTKNDEYAHEKFGQNEMRSKMIYSIISRSNDTLENVMPETGIILLGMKSNKELESILSLSDYEFNKIMNKYYTASNNISCNK